MITRLEKNIRVNDEIYPLNSLRFEYTERGNQPITRVRFNNEIIDEVGGHINVDLFFGETEASLISISGMTSDQLSNIQYVEDLLPLYGLDGLKSFTIAAVKMDGSKIKYYSSTTKDGEKNATYREISANNQCDKAYIRRGEQAYFMEDFILSKIIRRDFNNM
jgi:hypothetical protein